MDLGNLREPKLAGAQKNDFMTRVAAAGDVNADGEADVIVAGGAMDDQGVARVFFGPLPQHDASLGESPRRGFSIYGTQTDGFGSDARAAGDVNGDGLDDVLYVKGGFESTAYVVFGKASSEDVELAAFDAGTQGEAGFRIDGDFQPNGGTTGDTNGDGLAEVFVVSYDRVYVVRGKADTAPVDVTTFDLPLGGQAGYVIYHRRARRGGGSLAAFAGDANADGLGDVVIAAGRRDFNYDLWVVFGKEDDADVDARDLGGDGYGIDADLGNYGIGLDGAGDVNGDDLDDLVVGDASSNTAWVVFGRTETSDLSLYDLGGSGYRIVGPPIMDGLENAGTGRFVAGGADMNSDGLSDVLVAAPWADFRARRDAGSVYLVFGKDGTKTIRLRRVGDRGIRFDGERSSDSLGVQPEMPGDVTDDGLPDLLLGAIGRRGQGKVHVVSHHLVF